MQRLATSTWKTVTSLTVLVIGGTSCLFSHGAAVNPPQPNILMILVDDMGYQDLGCYGNPIDYTPNIDRLASEGIRFTEAYGGSAVCAPSRCVLLTGKHAGRAPIRGNTGGIPLRKEDLTLPQIFQEAGYTTGGFGKWGLGAVGTQGVPEMQGFDLFFGYYHQLHAHNYYPNYLLRNSRRVDMTGKSKDPSSYSHYEIFERTKAFIRENQDRPFFCFAAWTPPHFKYQIPPSDPAWRQFKDKPWSKKAKTHAAFIAMLDRNVGSLMELLNELDLDEETIVIFCSDHGASKGFEKSLNSSGQLRGHKGTMYEGGLRIPMILRWTDHIQPGQVSDFPWYFPDMMPTFAELAGIRDRIDTEIDGISIVPTLFGPEVAGREQASHDYLYWEYPRYNWIRQRYVPNGLRQALRKDEWKILRHSANQRWQLYNLEKDPREKNNLASKRPQLVEELARLVEQARRPPPAQREPKKQRLQAYHKEVLQESRSTNSVSSPNSSP